MCLTTEALVLFLNLLAPEMIRQEPGRLIVMATTRDAHWVARDGADRWCTMAPQIDRMERLAAMHID